MPATLAPPTTLLDQPVDIDGLITNIRDRRGCDLTYRMSAINLLAMFAERHEQPLLAGKLATLIQEFQNAPLAGMNRTHILPLEWAFHAMYFNNTMNAH